MAEMRPCDGCTQCCRFELPDLHPCPFLHSEGPGIGRHEDAADGCSIHTLLELEEPPGDPRPDRCRDFHCAYQLGYASKGLRPDRTGVVFAKPVGRHWLLRTLAADPLVAHFDSKQTTLALAHCFVAEFMAWEPGVDLVMLFDRRGDVPPEFVGNDAPVGLAERALVMPGGP